jgi:hypothetical protein
MNQILETVIAFLEEVDWAFERHGEQSMLRLDFEGKNGQWLCYARERAAENQFIFYSICPVKVPPERRLSMAELLTRLNFMLMIGNFDMDFGDGEVRYKTSIDVEGSYLTAASVHQLLSANVLIMDEYLPTLLAVIYGGMEPVQAIDQLDAPE